MNIRICDLCNKKTDGATLILVPKGLPWREGVSYDVCENCYHRIQNELMKREENNNDTDRKIESGTGR